MSEQTPLTIRLSPADNVVVARAELLPGAPIAGTNVTCVDRIPRSHKVTVVPVAKGEAIRKYDQVIGFATTDIEPGRHVHVHNVEMHDFVRDYAFGADTRPTAYVPEAERATFQGFRRANGKVGTRNYIGVLTSVNCSATVARQIAARVERDLLPDYPNVDGVVALTHGTGCGMADSGEGYANLQRVLWGYARNPNFVGVLIVGLGCEVNQIDFLLEAYGIQRGPLFQVMNIQNAGGSAKTIQAGIDMIRPMLVEADKARRDHHLRRAIDAGAAMRRFRRLFRHHGQPGAGSRRRPAGAPWRYRSAERDAGDLRRRTSADPPCGEPEGRRKADRADPLVGGLYRPQLGEMNNNPSPGNKAGGLTTILEKSLGAAAKGGTTNLVDVYKYAEPITAKGFVFMDSPGYDPASVTGQVASGCNIIAFTTGRGSVSGFKPAPSIKLATNTPMYQRMADDMDINCGTIADGEETIEQAGERIFQLILDIASGKHTKSEEQGFGDSEFVPWQIGAVM